MANEDSEYVLVSNDGQEISISEKVMKMSEVLKELCKHCSDKKVPLPDIEGTVLQKVVEFCKKYENEPEYVPPKAGDPDNKIPSHDSWEMQFLFVDHDFLRQIINAANYLDIPRLIDACCYRLALMIQGRGVEEIRRIFMIENDFTPEEEERMRREHIWYDCPLPPHPKFARN
ncbi:hypothetical protein FO519_007769 [Halicephalobus sp. NKZ332]|nr:hypothetical protein FO519_007769 [Halicephalobus sp. NKZ332]